jgi:peroxiredoxin
LGVVVGEDDNASAKKFVEQMHLSFPVAVDLAKQVRADYALQRIPTVVLVDANGNVARVYEGSSEQLSGIVEQTILAAAGGDRLPEYNLIGNGCSP